jgi:hypothetical protein
MLTALAGPAFADGYRGSLKDAPKPEERCKHSANVDIVTEYVFPRHLADQGKAGDLFSCDQRVVGTPKFTF